MTGVSDHCRVNSLVETPGCSPVEGVVRWDPVHSLWNGAMLAGSLMLAPSLFSWSALAIFLVMTGGSLLLGHSVGFHRRLIHRSFDCPLWLERFLVWVGTCVGMSGPFWMIRTHDLRDWAQRQSDCHDYLAHRRPMLIDAWWQMHCRLELKRPPAFDLGRAGRDRFYRFLEATWMVQQLPIALLLFAAGGASWVVWGVCMRVSASVAGHWFVGHLAHRRGPQSWLVAGPESRHTTSRGRRSQLWARPGTTIIMHIPDRRGSDSIRGKATGVTCSFSPWSASGSPGTSFCPNTCRSGARPCGGFGGSQQSRRSLSDRRRRPDVMLRALSFRSTVSPQVYLSCAPALILAQHLMVAGIYWNSGARLVADAMFWLFPLHRLYDLPDLGPLATALIFALVLLVGWALALLSFRRANWSGRGHRLAAFSFIPTIQIAAVAILAFLPSRADEDEPEGDEAGGSTAHVLEGALAGTTVIVAAVVVSAVSFGAYGWGLFVATPFMAGLVTGYLANRETPISGGETAMLVMGAGLLGTLALLMLALEGLMCILLIAPLAALTALIGGLIGRFTAISWHRRGPLASVAVLPLLFALEGAMPPSVPIVAEQSIDIAAPPATVWQALTSSEPIGVPPNIVGLVGLAYPVRGRIVGDGVGAERVGEFSTGSARERISDWVPQRRLAFTVLTQPPSMEEMSPYRRVHAPHVTGYFNTAWTSFDLVELPGGGTRLTARAAHELRIEPALYWEPIARWAIRRNIGRVLLDIRMKAERGRQMATTSEGASRRAGSPST